MPTQQGASELVFSVTGYGGWGVTGTGTSGVASGQDPSALNTSGPWWKEEQAMNYYYQRVPMLSRHALQDSDINLSSVTAVSGHHTETFLLIHAWGYYKRWKSTDMHNGGWIQSQRFDKLAVSSDYQGNNYGAMTAGSGTWGPQGQITTSRPWHHRRLWISGTDTEANQTVSGAYSYTALMAANTTMGYAGNLWNNYRGWMDAPATGQIHGPGGYEDLDEVTPTYGGFHKFYTIGGEYVTSQETNGAVQLVLVTDEVGRLAMTDGSFWDYYSRPGTGNTIGAWAPDYDISRHDYS